MQQTEPALTCLSYSAGVQSHCLLEMVLRGGLPKPERFLVLNADPGMEDSRTYGFVAQMRERCAAAGIAFITAPGPNLYRELTEFRALGIKRLDNPPYWTKNPTTGKVGRLQQNCTRHAKIRPLRRAMRQWMADNMGVSVGSTRLPHVETWIGFALDESNRAEKALKQKDIPKYNSLRFPLIELGMDRAKVEGYYLKHDIEKPPRSVCNACFANGLKYFEDMYYHRPDDWDKAVAVDESIRDLSIAGVKDQCFVSSTCIPLKDLPRLSFKKGDEDYADHRCNSGACFI